MLTGRGQLVLLLAAGVYLVAWGFGIREAYAVAVALALAPLVALLTVRGGRAPGAIRRTVAGGRVEGDELVVGVEVPVEGRGLRSVTLVDDTPVGPRRVRLARSGAVLSGSYVVDALPRGAYALSGARIVREDPFGLADGSAQVGGEHALLVRPRVVDLGRAIADGGVLGLDGRRRQLGRGAGFDLHSVREYQQGDSLRRVHWRSTARRQQLMVKELEEAPRDEVVVVLDCQSGFDLGSAPDSSFEAQVRATASLARASASLGLRCAVVTSGARIERRRIASLDAEWEGLLDALARVVPDGRRPAATVLADDRAGLDAARLLLVTSAMTPRLAEAVSLRARRGQAGVVWVDPRSFAPGGGAAGPDVADAAAAELVRRGTPVARVRRGDDLALALAGAVTAPRAVAVAVTP